MFNPNDDMDAWKCPLLSAVFLLLRGRSCFQLLLLIYSFIFLYCTTEAIVAAEGSECACVCISVCLFFTEASGEMSPPSHSIILLPYKESTVAVILYFF